MRPFQLGALSPVWAGLQPTRLWVAATFAPSNWAPGRALTCRTGWHGWAVCRRPPSVRTAPSALSKRLERRTPALAGTGADRWAKQGALQASAIYVSTPLRSTPAFAETSEAPLKSTPAKRRPKAALTNPTPNPARAGFCPTVLDLLADPHLQQGFRAAGHMARRATELQEATR